jgi:steroid 5-alpha reductase family enzyme
MLLWSGFFLIASGELVGNLQLACAALSPLFVSALLIKVSGIPLLEKSADKKWGGDKIYKHYKETVPVLIPFVGRAGDAAF